MNKKKIVIVSSAMVLVCLVAAVFQGEKIKDRIRCIQKVGFAKCTYDITPPPGSGYMVKRK